MADATASRRFTFAEVFAGIGGFRVGLEAVGGECVFACEYCRFASSTYRANCRSGVVPVGDVRRIAAAQVPPHDVMAAGFPCQSFSNAGRRGIFDDERGQLFFELVRLAAASRPRALLLENVRGLLTAPGALETVREALRAIGYDDLRILECDAALLVPQRRRRVYMVALRDGLARAAFRFPALPALCRCVGDVLEPATSPDLELPDVKWSRVAASEYYRRWPAARLLPVADDEDAPNENLGNAGRAPPALRLAPVVAQTLQTQYKSGYALYSQFVPQPAPALPRFFSPREVARLMGFPEDFCLPSQEGLAYVEIISPEIISPRG